MADGAGSRDQAETRAVGGAVGNAGVGAAFRDLAAGETADVVRGAVHFVFPSDEEGSREPIAKGGDDFWGGHEFGEEVAGAGGDFAGAQRLQGAGLGAGPDLAEGEVTHGGGVKDSGDIVSREGGELVAKAGGGGEGFDSGGAAVATPSGLLADEKDDLVAGIGQGVDEFGAESAGGEVGEPTNLVERLEGRPGGDHTFHWGMLVYLGGIFNLPSGRDGWQDAGMQFTAKRPRRRDEEKSVLNAGVGRGGRRVKPRGAAIRREWGLAPGIVFLNHGSFGACPKAVLRKQEWLRRQMEAEPVQFLWRRYEERLEPARQEVARFVGARARDVVFVTNATTGVNAVVGSMAFRRGDEVLTTNLDYNACRNALGEAARQAGAKLVVAEVPFPVGSEEEIMEAVLAGVTRRTRLVLLDHVTSNTALVLPVRRLTAELEGRGIPVLVDGAHAPGMFPLAVEELGATFYTGNLHKWVCAPKGTAFLWVREDWQERMQPAVVSHGNNTPRPGYSGFQDRFDWAGTFDPTGWFCAGEAIRWVGSRLAGGWPAVYRRNHAVAVKARRTLCGLLEVEAPCPEEMLGSMSTIPLPLRFQGRRKTTKLDPEQVRLYDDFSIEVPFVRIGRPERRYFRVSAHLYNQEDEYQYLGEMLRVQN